MSILIRGMEMPLEKSRIIQIYPDGTVRRLDGSIYNSHFEAVHVPPHGRLIDADVLCKVLQKNSMDEWNNKIAPFSWAYAYDCVKDTVEIMPTIIPAEEGGT